MGSRRKPHIFEKHRKLLETSLLMIVSKKLSNHILKNIGSWEWGAILAPPGEDILHKIGFRESTETLILQNNYRVAR